MSTCQLRNGQDAQKERRRNVWKEGGVRKRRDHWGGKMFRDVVSTPGRNGISQSVAYGSQVALNLSILSFSFATMRSCAIIHETFLLQAWKETEGIFQAFAIVILAPTSMKKESTYKCLVRLGMYWLSSAMLGLGVNVSPAKLLMVWKIFFQKDLMRGHDHHIWIIEPSSSHPRKQSGDVPGYINANLEGT